MQCEPLLEQGRHAIWQAQRNVTGTDGSRPCNCVEDCGHLVIRQTRNHRCDQRSCRYPRRGQRFDRRQPTLGLRSSWLQVAGEMSIERSDRNEHQNPVNPRQCAQQVDIGDGKLPFPALFKQLKKMGYTGCVNMEYEINDKDPMVGMQRSLSYMRGVLAGLAA